MFYYFRSRTEDASFYVKRSYQFFNPVNYEAVWPHQGNSLKWRHRTRQRSFGGLCYAVMSLKLKRNTPFLTKMSLSEFSDTFLRDLVWNSFRFWRSCFHTNAAQAWTKSGFANNGQPIMAYRITWDVEFLKVHSTQNHLSLVGNPPFER